MNMRLVKPEIAKRAGEEGKIYSFGKEIWRFILVFLIGSFIAGLIPAWRQYAFQAADPLSGTVNLIPVTAVR